MGCRRHATWTSYSEFHETLAAPFPNLVANSGTGAVVDKFFVNGPLKFATLQLRFESRHELANEVHSKVGNFVFSPT